MNDLTVTEYRDIRVLTTQQIADAYGTDAQVVTNNFNRKTMQTLKTYLEKMNINRHSFDKYL